MEQIKAAIAKARAERDAIDDAPTETPSPATKRIRAPVIDRAGEAPKPDFPAERDAIAANWDMLERRELNRAALRRARVVAMDNRAKNHVAFDIARTRLKKIVAETGWRRIGVTSPLPKCGKTVVCTNLAFAMARHEEQRVLLYDLDLKSPKLATTFGGVGRRPIRDWLTEKAEYADHFIRYSENFGVCFNTEPVRQGAELIESSAAAAALAQVEQALRPDIELFDLGPLLSSDDPLAIFPMLDCVMIVAAAGQTNPSDLIECERLIAEQTNYVGILLNKVKIMPSEREKYY